MARPPKNIDLREGNVNKDEIQKRKAVEQLFSGEFDGSLKPSNRLNSNQKKIFKKIYNHIKETGFLGNLDVIMLENTAIAIDRLHSIEKIINEDFERIRDRELLASKRQYQADLQKGVELFGLAPASRAKLGTLVANKKAEEQDPLLKVLKNKSS